MIKVLYLAFPREFCLTHSTCSSLAIFKRNWKSIVWRSWGSISELCIETFGGVVVLRNEKLWMFEGWNALHNPHKAFVAARLDTWTLQCPFSVLSSCPNAACVPRGLCQALQCTVLSVWEHSKLFFFFFFLRGRGKKPWWHNCVVYAVIAFFPARAW